MLCLMNDLPNGRKVLLRSVLIELKGVHPVVEKILEYRELSKIPFTYVIPLLEMGRTIQRIPYIQISNRLVHLRQTLIY